MYFKVWVVGEKLDETLSDGTYVAPEESEFALLEPGSHIPVAPRIPTLSFVFGTSVRTDMALYDERKEQSWRYALSVQPSHIYIRPWLDGDCLAIAPAFQFASAIHCSPEILIRKALRLGRFRSLQGVSASASALISGDVCVRTMASQKAAQQHH